MKVTISKIKNTEWVTSNGSQVIATTAFIRGTNDPATVSCDGLMARATTDCGKTAFRVESAW